VGEEQAEAGGGSDPGSRPMLTILVEAAPKLNFAAHQSSFAFLRDLRVVNDDPTAALSNVVLTLSASPAFLKPKSWHLDRLAPSSTFVINNRHIDLDGGFLLDLTESIRGTVTIVAESGGQIVGQTQKVVELLAYNEWGGGGYMPELLAAFSMPNDPAIDRVLRDASTCLRKAGKPDGIDGYKSGSRQRVWEIASAVYTAISNLGIAYALPPASFERDGQKIRLPSQILEGRLATCLDTTMLFASALEQAGLNPVIALPKGHAIVGVWLQPEELASIVVDEAETLRKRIQLKELVLIETTFVASHPPPPFSKAAVAANDCISPDKDETFLAAIDVRRARAHRITPLGRKLGGTSAASADEQYAQIEQFLEDAPPLPDFDGQVEDQDLPETPAGRLERWQRKLLDLSARNPLLNHKSSKTSLRLICPSPALLEDGLAAGSRFAIQAVPKPSGVGQDEEVHRQRTGEVITDEYARAALEKKQVLVDLPEEELNRRAVEIYRKAQTALQEGGANTLYLAIGFLLWKQDEKSDRRFRAPLILLPVTLERKSVRSGIRMLAHDDEPRFNTTLLEMLRKDFGIDIRDFDGPLPADVNGIDVSSVWERMRRAVKDAPGFEVIEDVVLGHFSFAKYLMWKDLADRTDTLRRNPVVKHLLDTPRERYETDVEFVESVDIDRKYVPSALLTPLPADASQMAAIATADRGKDFVVIGPPGTGKSQTISNLIAHLLGQGKTVLFVSEKTAALEVVYRRLKNIGLGRFCLELHSNKASKSDVLGQLRDAWSHVQQVAPGDWEKEGEKLRELRDRLNSVVDRLHVRRRNGLTAHHAIGVKVRDAALAPRVSLAWPSADHHDEASLRAMREAVEKLRIQALAVGDISESPFRLLTHDDWSPQWENSIIEHAARYSAATHKLERSCEDFLRATGIGGNYRTISEFQAMAELASVLIECWQKRVGFALDQDGSEKIEALVDLAGRVQAFAEAEASLSCPYEPLAWRKVNGDDIVRRWQAATSTWWPKSYFARRALVKELKESGAKGTPNPSVDAPHLARLRQEGEAIDRLGNLLSGIKGWRGHTTDANAMLALKDLALRVRTATGRLAGDSATLLEARSKIRTLLQDGDDLLAPEAAVGRAAFTFTMAYGDFLSAHGAFAASAGESIRERLAEAEDMLSAIKHVTRTVETRRPELRGWCQWQRRRMEAIDLGLDPLVRSIERGLIPVEEIEETFYVAYCAWWSAAVIGEDNVLRTFSTDEHYNAIEKFRQADAEFQKLTAAEIAARLSAKVPGASQQKPSSSWGTLRREMEKKTRHKPVRQLVLEAPDALTALKPCLMMSPLSIAQYLPAEHSPFDVVIFDEASQITVWDAVGALARGKQIIVAGDPKQMPPTNFFARGDDDPDGDVDIEGDLESILDEMLGASIPQRTLNLHYRSRRESLIAFSNSRYYGNSLVTFPAPVTPDQGIRLVRPNGFYVRGGARHNDGEARAVVEEVVRRLTHADPAVSKASIGVVTFNSEQQMLIENLLDDARAKRPDIEWAFSRDSTLEPVFVKNLETYKATNGTLFYSALPTAQTRAAM
jgi:DNA polymerase III delta prime subunit